MSALPSVAVTSTSSRPAWHSSEGMLRRFIDNSWCMVVSPTVMVTQRYIHTNGQYDNMRVRPMASVAGMEAGTCRVSPMMTVINAAKPRAVVAE